jgi:hypothetical protein
MGDFHRYYSGEKLAPVLTLVIGGNHEASNYLSKLYYGGWLAPNIYYIGNVNVLRYGPIRIAGLSGIFKSADYQEPHYEHLPYDRNEIRSVYHVREWDISKLLQVRLPVDIGISHDWPRRMEWFGDYEKLFVDRPSFLESAITDNLGSAPAEEVKKFLRPRYWFSGHMHVKYSAVVEQRAISMKTSSKTWQYPTSYRLNSQDLCSQLLPGRKRVSPSFHLRISQTTLHDSWRLISLVQIANFSSCLKSAYVVILPIQGPNPICRRHLRVNFPSITTRSGSLSSVLPKMI